MTRIISARNLGRRLHSTSSFTPPALTGPKPIHLLSLADLPISRIQDLVSSAIAFKQHYKSNNVEKLNESNQIGFKSLEDKTVALMFNKRSTRTRVASETSIKLLGGHPMFLGAGDIQLGVNESLYDTARVISSMVDGIMARVGSHEDVEALAASSSVPVINALSSLYHPTQILADLQTLLEFQSPPSTALSSLKCKTIAWIGDSNNILNEMLVTYPRLGVNLRIATPVGYELDAQVLKRAKEGVLAEGGNGEIFLTNSPEEAVKGADVVTTDTWISMGQEEEAQKRLNDFTGFQITPEMLIKGGAKADCLFMHCLPRHLFEVNDEVFYGKNSVVFEEAENRKWTILAVFDSFIGKGKTVKQ